MERKNFLRSLVLAAATGPMLLDACKKESTKDTLNDTESEVSNSSGCSVTPTETEGPYPYPAGEINNPLDRADVTGGQTGVPLTLTLTVVNTNDNCALVQNARVDIWHCNKDGYYSGYGNQNSVLGTKSYVGQDWLRGYQTTGANGQVTFETIYPGWYSGRATHIHMEVFIGGVMKKTSQMAFPESISNTVHTSTLYAAHGTNTTSNASDGILGNSAADLAKEMLTLTGNVTDGYAGTLTIGIPL